ncbi:MAG: triose-phosphate isomerase [Holosporales bacterium]|jgi:triosephosphate isomerase|nr:triose-phosphate isomerase [Holosporales bacterium]
MSKLVVCNWKMNGSIQLVDSCVSAMAYLPNDVALRNLVIAMPDIFLAYANSMEPRFKLAAQDCSVYGGSGAHTGEVSADMLMGVGVKYVILGHSERRSRGEDTELIHAKLASAVRCGITAILCVSDDYESQITEQIEGLLQAHHDDVILAYEPVSAIGTGRLPGVGDIQRVAACLRRRYVISKVMYGGSVTSANALNILKMDEISGVLVGGASLKVDEVSAILAAASQCMSYST